MGWSTLTRREKFLVALTIVALLYAIFKQPDVKITTIKDYKEVEVVKWKERKLTKDFLNIRGLTGSTVKFNPDGSYEIVGPFELSRSTTGEVVTESERKREVDAHEKTVTEPAQAWRLAARASALVPIDHLDFRDVSWTVGGTAHVGQLKIFALRFDIGVGGEVWRSMLTQRTLVGPNILVTF
jgi:hypothetical protein